MTTPTTVEEIVGEAFREGYISVPTGSKWLRTTLTTLLAEREAEVRREVRARVLSEANQMPWDALDGPIRENLLWYKEVGTDHGDLVIAEEAIKDSFIKAHTTLLAQREAEVRREMMKDMKLYRDGWLGKYDDGRDRAPEYDVINDLITHLT